MNPKVGLALGGRAARGLAHLGVLKVLEDAKIPLHIITGTSLGAMVEGLYTSRPDAGYWMACHKKKIKVFVWTLGLFLTHSFHSSEITEFSEKISAR